MSNDHTPHGLQRNLKNRHLQLIAIGGAIGTGLFMGSGKTIHLAGPSVLLTYVIIGTFLFFIMRAMGELLLSNLEYKSFTDFTYDLLGPAAGFFVGWTYWFCWVVIGMADIIAITGYTQFWWPDVPLWLPGLFCIVIMAGMNLLTVKLFGEMEFWFALIKIIAILLLVVVGLFLVFTGFIDPSSGEKASFAHLWNKGGFFPNGIGGFFSAFQIAVFAFVGIELVGTAAAETKDPETNLPKAINRIPVRIIVFYVLALGVIMTVTPWSEVNPAKKPVREYVHPYRHPDCRRFGEFGGADIRAFLCQRRHVLHRPHAVRLVRRRCRTENVFQAEPQRRAGHRIAVFLYLPCRGDFPALPKRRHHGYVHHRDHGFQHRLHFRVDYDFAGLSEIPQNPSATA